MKRKYILCVLLATLLLTGCGGNTSTETEASTAADTTPVETTPVETEPQYKPLPEVDMGGWTMRFINYNDTALTWAIHNLVAEETNGDAMNDEIWARNNRIAEQYNTGFSETAYDWVDRKLGALVQAGDAGGEVAMLYDETIITPFVSGYLQTWEVLPHVDFTADYWNQSSTDTFKSQGKVFAATGDFSLGQNTRSFVLMFNKDMYADLGLTEDLYQLTMDGKWTMDALIEVEEAAILDLDGDGEMTMEDRYGTGGAVKLYFGSLVTGAGIKYIDIGEDGMPYFAIPGNENAITMMVDLLEKHAGTSIFCKVTGDIHNGSNEAREMFKNNQFLFCGTSMKAIVNYRDMESDIGILPFPKYTEDQDNYYALTSGGTMATLPKTLNPEFYENTGILLEALCRDSHTGLVPLYKETLLKSRYARDEGSAAMLDIIFASATYDMGLSVFSGSTYYKYMEPYLKMNNTFASLTQSITPTVEKDLAKLLEASTEG